MPTDTLVDLVVQVKLVNVRKSLVNDARAEVVSALAVPEDEIYLWDEAELGPLQVVEAEGILAAVGEAGQNMALKRMPACVPMPTMTPNDPVEKAEKESISRTKPKKYQPIPPHFEQKLIEYIQDHPKTKTTEIRSHFNVTSGAAAYYLEQLLKKGMIRSFRLGDNTKDGTSYEVIADPKPPIPKPSDVSTSTVKAVQAPASSIVAESVPVEPAEPERDDEIMKLVREFVRMPSGEAKDKKLELLILKLIEKQPGMSTAYLADRLGQPATRIRKLMMDLEDAGKVVRRMVPTVDGRNSKTGFYLKGAR